MVTVSVRKTGMRLRKETHSQSQTNLRHGHGCRDKVSYNLKGKPLAIFISSNIFGLIFIGALVIGRGTTHTIFRLLQVHKHARFPALPLISTSIQRTD